MRSVYANASNEENTHFFYFKQKKRYDSFINNNLYVGTRVEDKFVAIYRFT